MRIQRLTYFLLIGACFFLAGAADLPAMEPDEAASDYEVWAVDQSDTVEGGGGTIYIYEGAALAGGWPSLKLSTWAATRSACAWSKRERPRCGRM